MDNLRAFEWHDLPLTALTIGEDAISLLVEPWSNAEQRYHVYRLRLFSFHELRISIEGTLTLSDLSDMEITTFDYEWCEDGLLSGTLGILPSFNRGYWTLSFDRARYEFTRVDS